MTLIVSIPVIGIAMELGCLLTIIIIVSIIGTLFALIFYKFYQLTKPLEPPSLDIAEYWGKENSTSQKPDISVKPFRIEYDDKTIDMLLQKLNEPLTLHPPLEGVKHEYGMNSKDLIDFVDYWRSDYMPRWNERQQFLNSVPHFKTQIQGYAAAV